MSNFILEKNIDTNQVKKVLQTGKSFNVGVATFYDPTSGQFNAYTIMAIDPENPRIGRVNRTYLTVNVNKNLKTEEALKSINEQIDQAFNEFEKIRSELNEIYDYKIKKLKMSTGELEHLSKIEEQNLISQFDEEAILSYASILGKDLEYLDTSYALTFENTSLSIKEVLLFILSKRPDLDLSQFLKDPTKAKTKKEFAEEVLAVDKYSDAVVLKNGDVIGGSFNKSSLRKGNKIDKYVKSLVEQFEVEKDLHEKKRLYNLIEKFWDLLLDKSITRFLHRGLEQRESEIENAAIEIYFYDKKPESIHSEIDYLLENRLHNEKTDLDAYKDSFKKKLSELKSVYEELIGKFKFEDEVLVCLENSLKEGLKRREVRKGLKAYVLAKLKEEKKPVTVGRIKKKVQDYSRETEVYMRLYDSDIEVLFSEEIALSLKQQEDKSKNKRKVKYNAKRISDPERSVNDLTTKWNELSEEDRTHLLGNFVRDWKGLVFFVNSSLPSNLEVMVHFLKKYGKVAYAIASDSYRFNTFKSYALRALIEMGAKDLVNWDDMRSCNVEDLLTFVPDSHVVKALELLPSCLTSKTLYKNLEDFLPRVEAVINKENSELVLDVFEKLAKGDGELFDLLETFSQKFSKVNSKFYRIIVHTTGQSLDNDKLLSIKDPSLHLYLFHKYHREKNFNIAKRFLKAVLDADQLDFSELKNNIDNSNLNSLGKDIFLNPSYAPIIVLALKKHRRPIFKSSWDGHHNGEGSVGFNHKDFSGSSLYLVYKQIFDAAQIDNSERQEILKEIHGEESEVYFDYMEDNSPFTADDIVNIYKENIEALISKYKEEINETRKKGWGSYSENRVVDKHKSKLKRLTSLPEKHLPFFGKLLEELPEYREALLQNIFPYFNYCKENNLELNLSENALSVISSKAGKILQKNTHSAHLDTVRAYLSFFSDNYDLSLQIILQSEFKPLQAKIAAQTLERSAVEDAKDILISKAQSHPEALSEVLKVVIPNKDSYKDEASFLKLSSHPSAVTTRLLRGDKNLSEKEWKVFFNSEEHIKDFILNCEDDKLFSQVTAMGEIYETDLVKTSINVLEESIKYKRDPNYQLLVLLAARLIRLTNAGDDIRSLLEKESTETTSHVEFIHALLKNCDDLGLDKERILENIVQSASKIIMDEYPSASWYNKIKPIIIEYNLKGILSKTLLDCLLNTKESFNDRIYFLNAACNACEALELNDVLEVINQKKGA